VRTKKAGQILGEEIIAWIESECRGLIERYGIDAKLFDWSDEITADRPRKQGMNLNDICGARSRICRRWCERGHAPC
jgi:hypothetical protein